MSELSLVAPAISGSSRAGSSLVAVLLLFLLSSCAFTASSREREFRSTVADDLALSLTSLIDAGVPLYMEEPQNRYSFSAALQSSLRQQGFMVVGQMSATALPVSYSIESVTYEKGATEEYIVSVGPLIMTQEYQRDNQGIYPVSELAVETNDPGQKASEQNVLQNTRSSVPPAILPAPAKAATNGAGDPFAPIVAPHDGTLAAAVVPVPESAAIVPQLPASLAYIERKNMYETGVSVFNEYTREYDSVDKQILVFPNDSLRITDRVRVALDLLSQQFRADSDVVSVIGCSHGNTNLDNGNALLAVGRSKRVKRYLADQGVPPNRILDEGCWAPVHFDEKMPRRGVVIELKRIKV